MPSAVVDRPSTRLSFLRHRLRLGTPSGGGSSPCVAGGGSGFFIPVKAGGSDGGGPSIQVRCSGRWRRRPPLRCVEKGLLTSYVSPPPPPPPPSQPKGNWQLAGEGVRVRRRNPVIASIRTYFGFSSRAGAAECDYWSFFRLRNCLIREICENLRSGEGKNRSGF